MKDLKDMLGRKPKEKDPAETDAKLRAIKQLKAEAMSMMGDSMKAAMDKPKAVTVAGETTEDLKEGLEKAEELLDSEDMEESDDSEEMSADDEIKMLEDKLAELKRAKSGSIL